MNCHTLQGTFNTVGAGAGGLDGRVTFGDVKQACLELLHEQEQERGQDQGRGRQEKEQSGGKADGGTTAHAYGAMEPLEVTHAPEDFLHQCDPPLSPPMLLSSHILPCPPVYVLPSPSLPLPLPLPSSLCSSLIGSLVPHPRTHLVTYICTY